MGITVDTAAGTTARIVVIESWRSGGRSIEILAVARLGDFLQEQIDLWEFRREEAGEFLTFRGEEYYGGKSFDLIFLHQGFVLFCGLLVLLRHVDFHENIVFGGTVHEFFFREDVFTHGDARWAPIRSGELD